jgi:MFS family permease
MNDISFSRRFVIPCLIVLMQSLFMWSVLTYITIYWIDKGFSHLQVGILVSIFPLTSLLLMIPFGIYVDRISPKRLTIFSLFIFALAPAGLIIWHDFWSTAVLLGIGGVGATLFNNALPSLYYKVLGDKSRGFKLGVLNAATLVGYGLGPLIAGFLLSFWDMNAVFILSFSGLLPLLVLSSFLPDVPGTRVLITDYKADISNKSVLVFIIVVFAYSLHAGAEQTSFSLYLNKDIGLGKDVVGLIYFIHATFMAVCSVINGIIGDRFHARGRGLSTLLYIGVAISGLTNMLLFFTFNFGTVLATRLTHAVGDSLSLAIRSLIISNMFVSSRMGGNLGVITATITLATLIGSIISGAVPGYVSGFVICGAIALLAIPIALLSKPEF